MRFTINRDYLLKAINIANKPVGQKNPLPILLCLLLTLDEQGLTIVGSNSELSIATTIPYKDGDKDIISDYRQGAILVKSKYFTEIIRKLSSDYLNVEVVDETIITIEDAKSSFKLNSIVSDEYPDIDFEKTGETFSVSCQELTKLVERTAFAASQKEQRPILTALNLTAKNNTLIGCATDSARFARQTLSINDEVNFNVNVPAHTITEVVRLFENCENVTISVNDKKILFSFGNTLISSRLISGDYPNTQSIVPNNFNYFLEVNASELINAIERASLLSTDRINAVKLIMNEEEVEVCSKAAQVGSAKEKVEMFSFSGENFEISFNSEFVTSAIKALKCDDVTISFVMEMKAFVIKNPKDDSVVQLVTPVRS